MKRQLIIASVTLALGVTACGSQGSSAPVDASAHLVEAKSAHFAPVDPKLDVSPLARSVSSLGYRLAPDLMRQTDHGNLVFSPLSLQVALAMVREGARGDTATAMDRALQLPENRGRLFAALIRALRADTTHGTTLDVGDGVFVDPSFPVRPSYLTALKKWYDTGVFKTAFPSPALDVINAFVNDETHGRIPHLVSEIPEGTMLDLVNTVYLKATWAFPFEMDQTTDAPFTTSDDSQVQVKMMSKNSVLSYAETSDWQAVRLPYKGNRLSMVVLLPTRATDPLDLLSPQVLTKAAHSFLPTDVRLDLPRWDLDNRLDLKDPLTALGLGDLMTSPDLSGIAKRGLAIGQVLQQANITVGEKGTVAAAATSVMMVGGMPVAPVPLTVDHPFAFVIQDYATGTPLFEGVVSDPS